MRHRLVAALLAAVSLLAPLGLAAAAQAADDVTLTVVSTLANAGGDGSSDAAPLLLPGGTAQTIPYALNQDGLTDPAADRVTVTLTATSGNQCINHATAASAFAAFSGSMVCNTVKGTAWADSAVVPIAGTVRVTGNAADIGTYSFTLYAEVPPSPVTVAAENGGTADAPLTVSNADFPVAVTLDVSGLDPDDQAGEDLFVGADAAAPWPVGCEMTGSGLPIAADHTVTLDVACGSAAKLTTDTPDHVQLDLNVYDPYSSDPSQIDQGESPSTLDLYFAVVTAGNDPYAPGISGPGTLSAPTSVTLLPGIASPLAGDAAFHLANVVDPVWKWSITPTQCRLTHLMTATPSVTCPVTRAGDVTITASVTGLNQPAPVTASVTATLAMAYSLTPTVHFSVNGSSSNAEVCRGIAAPIAAEISYTDSSGASVLLPGARFWLTKAGAANPTTVIAPTTGTNAGIATAKTPTTKVPASYSLSWPAQGPFKASTAPMTVTVDSTTVTADHCVPVLADPSYAVGGQPVSDLTGLPTGVKVAVTGSVYRPQESVTLPTSSTAYTDASQFAPYGGVMVNAVLINPLGRVVRTLASGVSGADGGYALSFGTGGRPAQGETLAVVVKKATATGGARVSTPALDYAVSVSPSATLTLTSPPATLYAGEPSPLHGSLAVGDAHRPVGGAAVTAKLMSSTGKLVATLGTTTTAADGTFTVNLLAKVIASGATLKVVTAAVSGVPSGLSTTSVTVEAQTVAAGVAVTSTTSLEGQPGFITGSAVATGGDGVAYPAAGLTVRILAPDGTVVGSAVTTNRGGYSIAYTPGAAGTYTVKAPAAGVRGLAILGTVTVS